LDKKKLTCTSGAQSGAERESNCVGLEMHRVDHPPRSNFGGRHRIPRSSFDVVVVGIGDDELALSYGEEG